MVRKLQSKKKSVVFILGFFLLMHNLSYSQNSPFKNYIISADYHYGIIMGHRKNIVHLIKGRIGAGELTYTYRTSGSKPWQRNFKFPEIGISLMHFWLANPTDLGNLNAVYPFIKMHLNGVHKKFNSYIKLGCGLSYLSKPYDRITNHQNNAIGSHLNACVNIRLATSIKLNQSLQLESGIGLTHSSNGAIKTPNLGLNLLTANLGVAYVFGDKNLEFNKDSTVKQKQIKKNQSSIIGIVGIKELDHPAGDKYFSYALIGNRYRILNEKNKLGTGFEFVYSSANKQQLIQDSIAKTYFKDVIKVGVKIGYAFVIHRLSIPVDFGFYVYKNKMLSDNYYTRIGFQYLLQKHFIVNATLYSHFARADYLEWGCGYQF